MLEDIIRREDVSKLLVDMCNSKRYYDKKTSSSMGYQIYSGVEQVLFIFYDALFKYKIIIEDMDYFDEFLEQVDKLIRKIDSFSEIFNGINRIIGRICACKLGCCDVECEQTKEEVLRYIYDKYVLNGYYIHGFSPRYYTSISDNGFIVEEYSNFYPKFKKVQDILKKKKSLSLLDKNFDLKTVSFTDSFVLGCYYSANAPMYFSSFLCRNEFINDLDEVDAYSNGDYDLCLRNLYRIISRLKLRDSQKRLFLDVFRCEWKLLDKSNLGNITLMLVPKKLFMNNFDIDKFIDDTKNSDFLDAVCKMLGQRNKIVVDSNNSRENIRFIN